MNTDLNAPASFAALIDRHTAAFADDCAIWDAYSGMEELPEIKARPPARVIIGYRVLWGRDENGAEMKEPIWAWSEDTIREEAEKNFAVGVGLFVRPTDVEGMKKRRARYNAWASTKIDELKSLRAERQRIQDECGYNLAEERAKSSSELVRAIESEILDYVPTDFSEATAKASWVANAIENEVGYFGDGEDFAIRALKAIGRASA